jgi:sec-independent protein translocase protein TatA
MGPIGVQEMVMIFLVALVLFGPKKLPELGRLLGKGLSEFRKAKNELKATFETHLNELDREVRLSDPQSKTAADYSPSRYSHPYDEYGRSSYDSSYTEPPAIAPAEAPAPVTEANVAHEAPAAAESAPVAGTVPRSNGFHAADRVSPSTEEEHAI